MPWMQRSITEKEERLKRKMVQYTERKIAEVHQHLDAFELRMLARPSPSVDMSTIEAAVDSLRADIDTILEARMPESEAPSVEPVEDTVLAGLFALQRFHHLPLESMPRGVGIEQRMRREHGRRSAERRRLRGEPHLLRRRRTR